MWRHNLRHFIYYDVPGDICFFWKYFKIILTVRWSFSVSFLFSFSQFFSSAIYRYSVRTPGCLLFKQKPILD